MSHIELSGRLVSIYKRQIRNHDRDLYKDSTFAND